MSKLSNFEKISDDDSKRIIKTRSNSKQKTTENVAIGSDKPVVGVQKKKKNTINKHVEQVFYRFGLLEINQFSFLKKLFQLNV